jgi:hypothetical protein
MPVLLITVDGLAADRLALFGGELATPALEELADDGVVWRDGWTSSPMTRPAVASYLTGLAPDRHGMRDEIYSVLPEEIPTLAALLAAKGYSTAAFPNSSFLGYDSGLLRGFDLADEPPAPPIGPERMMPLVRAAQSGADNFKLWSESLPAGEAYFAWFHFSGPMLDQLADFIKTTKPPAELGERAKRIKRRQPAAGGDHGKGDQSDATAAAASKARGRAKGVPPDEGHAVAAFDAALRTILDVLAERGESDNALVIVAATQADIGGGGHDARGPGFSLDERAVRVPVIARFPKGAAEPRSPDAIVWAPDIPATIADLTGIELSDKAEGLSLLQSPPDDRIIYTWSWATLDQMGWLPLRAARLGEAKMQQGVEPALLNLGEEESAIDAGVEQRLGEALGSRIELPAPVLDVEQVRPWLERQGVEIDPLPVGGRAFDAPDERRRASDFLWKARLCLARRFKSKILINYETAKAADPDAFCPMFELGWYYTLVWSPEAERMMKPIVARYPFRFDALHWYAHSIWLEKWAEAEEMVDILLAFRPQDMDLLYDKACARSLAGDIPTSIEFLESAIQAGFTRWNTIQSDRDLRNLRETPEFSELLRNYGR